MKKKIAVSNLFSLILGMVITGSLVYAQVNYNSDQVLYDKNGEKISTTEAIDELYSLADGQYNAGYNAGMQKFIDENACDVIDGTMVHNSDNGGAGGSTSADSSGYSVTTVGNNNGNGYVRITLVSAKYHK